MSGFSFSEESVKLPTGAYAGTRRRMLRLDGQAVLGVTAGQFRPYLYPVYTPAGFAATSEGPADHPHHHSIWAGADHLHLRMPALGGRDEIYAYNCYVNDIFQGRAPGRVNQIALAGQASGAGFLIEQEIEWRGPVEWGAPQGRLLLREQRHTRVQVGDTHITIDMECAVTAAEYDILIGPSRHAWFNFRVAPSMCVDEGGILLDNTGHAGRAAGVHAHAEWVAGCGPVGGGHTAGIALAPRRHAGDANWWWFVGDFGVVTASPCRDDAIDLTCGQSTTLAARFVVFDGFANTVANTVSETARIAAMLAQPH